LGKTTLGELSDVYFPSNIIRVIKSRRMKWTGHVALMGERKDAYKFLAEKPQGKRPCGRPRHRWENNIKTDLQDVDFGDMDWVDMAQDRDRWRELVNVVMNHLVS
jgi:hypothetical protein